MTAIPSRILVLVERGSLDSFVDRVSQQAIFGWAKHIEIRGVTKLTLSRQSLVKDDSDLAAIGRLLDDDSKFAEILVEHRLGGWCSIFKSRNLHPREMSHNDLFVFLRQQLKDLGWSWRKRADSEWDKSSIKYCNTDAWLQQFSELGIGWVGENLLRQLTVVSDAELLAALRVTPEERIGLRIAHAYVKDDEPGSSSEKIKHVLGSHYTPEPVIQFDLADSSVLREGKYDVVYVYEDGLWSGVELVNRLQALINNPSFTSSRTQFHFRFCITTDAGLTAGRWVLRKSGTNNIFLPPARSPAHCLSFFYDATKAVIDISNSASEAQMRAAVDVAVAPLAFRSAELWRQRHLEGMRICHDIGKQLVRPWLALREVAKGGTNAMRPMLIPDDKVDRWALGALGFGSTIVFASSIPKPVVPLFWLDGETTYGTKRIYWKPLFWDSRRIGREPPPR